MARGLLSRIGGHATVEAGLEDFVAHWLLHQGKPEAALPHFDRALVLQEQAQTSEGPGIPSHLLGRASVLVELKRSKEAVADSKRAAEAFTRLFGADYPGIAVALVSEGRALRVDDRWEDALQIFTRG